VILERSGGERVSVTRYDPPTPRATVLVLPALGVPASYYGTFASALSERGHAVAAVDHRGNGTSSVTVRRGVDFGYATLVEDARIAIRACTAPTFVLGHSLGGHLATLAAAEGEPFAGIALVASGTPFHERFAARDGRRIRLGATAIPFLASVFGYYPGKVFGFGGAEARTVMREWAAVARDGRFIVSGIDKEPALATVALPVLAVSLDHDWMAPRSAVDHLVEKMPHARVERIHLADAPRETLDHFRWARHPRPIVDVVERWLSALTR
jgi:predicted alpha/beta hydrolase